MLIQIVDDNPNMRGAIKSVLGGLGAKFIESTDGDEAVSDFLSGKPDLVLMDILMVRVDGITAMKAILRESPEAKVIIVTQYDDDDLRAAAQRAGAAGYVLKDDLSQILPFLHSISRGLQ